MNYKGFYIDDCMYGMITVQYCGDDVVFRSVDEAKHFVDEIAEEDQEMRVIYSGRFYEFRECDTEGISQEELQELTDKTGHMQYEPGGAWLVVKGIGYGWEVQE